MSYTGRIQVGMQFRVDDDRAPRTVISIALHGDEEPSVEVRYRRGIGAVRSFETTYWESDFRKRAKLVVP